MGPLERRNLLPYFHRQTRTSNVGRCNGYDGSYRSVLRFVRAHYQRPRIRIYRCVETPPGAQSQTDWGEFRKTTIYEDIPGTFRRGKKWIRYEDLGR